MASPAGQFRPWRLISTFAIITAVLYALVFFTAGSNAPKLGIDLQGGTRVTLTAQTVDGSTPSSDSMTLARQIMETRVNGSGVVGAQVQVDGANHLVITVPGNENLSGLTRPARLNIRTVLGQGYDPALLAAAASTSATTGATSGAVTSGAVTSGAATSVATAAPTSSAAVGPPPSSTGATSKSSQGLRANAAATTPLPATSAAGTKPAVTTAVPRTAAATGATTARAATTAPAATTASPVASAPSSSGATPITTPAGAAVSSAAPLATAIAPVSTAPAAARTGWPIPGSDPNNPSQPAAKDAAGWATWVTAATTAVRNNSVSCGDLNKTRGNDEVGRPLLACGTGKPQDNASVYLLDATLIPGNQVSSAGAVLDSTTAGWVINVSFNSTGFNTWSNYTTNNVGKQTAFTLDGQVISAPSIRQAITTPVTQVSGSFTQQSATALANSLKFGALPLNFDAGESVSISAQLGLQYLRAGLIAGGIGLLLVIVYCMIYYRLLGVITILSLVLSFSLVYAVLVLLGRWISLSLDIAGVAGLIVAIGITADSFVIYFERLKDEVREGRSFRSAVPRGWERAKRTILSADAVSFLSALILYLIAVGGVRGFAFTLGLSTILDLVVVYLVTHPLVSLAAGSKLFRSAKFSGLGAVAAAGQRQRAATARLAPKEA